MYHKNSNINKVKIQDSFEFYDIMYGLYREVLKSSLYCRIENFDTVDRYFRALDELFDFTEPYIKSKNIHYLKR